MDCPPLVFAAKQIYLKVQIKSAEPEQTLEKNLFFGKGLKITDVKK